LARAEIKRSAELNPSLAETHIARSLLLYEGYQNAEAIRELRFGEATQSKCRDPGNVPCSSVKRAPLALQNIQ